MGTEVAWVPLVMSAVAAAGTAYEGRRTAKKADQALASRIDNNAAKTREANARASQAISATEGNTPEGARNESLAQFVQALQSANPVATQGLGAKSGASDRFNEQAQEASLGVAGYGARQAGMAASVDAFGRSRQGDSVAQMRAGSDLQNLERQARARDFLDGLKVNSASQGRPWADALLQAIGGAAGSMGGGGKKAATGYNDPNYAAGFNFNFGGA